MRIPLARLRDGFQVHGDTIGELGYGNTPVDMVKYVDATDGKEYLLVTNNSRGATRVAFADVDQAAPMPVNARTISGRQAYPIGSSAMSFSNAPVF